MKTSWAITQRPTHQSTGRCAIMPRRPVNSAVEAVEKLNFEKRHVCDKKLASQNALDSTISGRRMVN